jgi:drug/metabolite transporter (DMT)-like permease
MKSSDAVLLLVCAALWGASFMFVRMSASEFGPVALAGIRVAGAALVLLPLVVWHGTLRDLTWYWKPIAVSGISNATIPLVLFGFAAQTISAGLMAILNAVTPLFAALVAWAWLGKRLTPMRIAGSMLGFGGVVWLALGQAALNSAAGTLMSTLAILAAVAGSALYGFSANYTKERLAGVSPIAVAAGGQLVSAAILAIPAALFWPQVSPSPRAWGALVALSVFCTALAYVLFFRLIGNIGATRATTVSYLIPGFGVTWGALFLGEVFSADMAVGCAVILCGTALTNGVWPRPKATPSKRAAPQLATSRSQAIRPWA